MKLETVPCGLCGSADAEPLYQADNFRLRVTDQKFWLQRCRACGLVYTSPRPVADEMAAFYCCQYYTPNSPRIVKGLNRFFNRERLVTSKRLKSAGRVLDIGCGDGGYLNQLALEGFDVYGVEPSLSVEDCLPERIRGRVHRGTLESCPFPEHSFDLITLWHVLEHVPEPLETLRQARRLLKTDGVLLIEVPNFGSFEARWFGPHWFALDVPRHYWHFTKESLRAMSVKSGFAEVTADASASAWSQPSFVMQFLLSSGLSFSLWAQERLGGSARGPVWSLALKTMGVAACLLCRLWPHSLPTMRLVARTQK